MKLIHVLGLAALGSLLPAAAMAHTGTGAHIDMMHGFTHPLTGLDHVLAMVAVGVFAARLGGRAIWLVPAAFVAAMAAGGALGYFGPALPMVEQGIALSVILLGVAVALGIRLPTALAMGLVGVFAVFHGHAHGAEGASASGFLPYAAGFIAATSLLHMAGVALGLSLDRLGVGHATHARRVIGAIGAIAGAVILAG